MDWLDRIATWICWAVAVIAVIASMLTAFGLDIAVPLTWSWVAVAGVFAFLARGGH